MKKLLIILTIISIFSSSIVGFAESGSYILNGKTINKDIKIKFDETRNMYLPLNTLSEELGYKIKMDETTKKVTVYKDKEEFSFYLEGTPIKDDPNIIEYKGTQKIDNNIMIPHYMFIRLFNGSAGIDKGKLVITAKTPITPLEPPKQNVKLTKEEKEKFLVRVKGKIVSMDVRNIFGMDEVLHLSVKIGDKNMYFYLLGVNKGPSITQKQLDEFMSEYIGKELDFVIDRSYFGKQIQMITGNHFAGYIYSGDKMLNAELIKSGLYVLDETNVGIILLDDIKEMINPTNNTNLKGINNTAVIKNK